MQYDRVQRKIGFRNSGASFEHDSVLSKSGANVRVHVLKQGQPIQSGYARLSVTDWQQSMGVGWARTLPEQRKWRDSIWQFVERIDQTGHATFKSIPPGEYHIEAIAGADASFDKISDIPVARYDGLCLIPGANNQVTVQLAKANRDLRFRIHTPNGKLSGPKRIGIQYGRTTMNTSTSRVPGKDGVLSFSLQQVGMHQMKFEAKDADVRRVPTIDPKYVLPYIVGVSSLYSNDQPIDIHLLEHEEVVRVQLHDRNNQAATGVVAIRERRASIPSAFGATDPNGQITLAQFDESTGLTIDYCLDHPRSNTRVTLSAKSDDLVSGRQWSSKSIRAKSGETRIVREQAFGFARGRIEFPEGLHPSDYKFPNYQQFADFVWDDDGRFLMGPLAPATYTVTWRFRGSSPYKKPLNLLLTAKVNIRAGSMTETVLRLEDTSARDFFSNSIADKISGTISIAADNSRGETDQPIQPAANAKLVAFFPSENVKFARGRTNGSGGFWLSPFSTYAEPDWPLPGMPTENCLLAWVPGSTSKQLFDLSGQDLGDLRLVLERGHRVGGTVTVNGKSPIGIPAPITLRLAHRGFKPLDQWMSFNISVDAHGRFELNGVASGEYTCQAALDELWLSNSVDLIVTQDKTLRLDIAEPGDPTVVQFVGQDRKPIRGQPIEIKRATGPLTEAFQSLRPITDGAGQATLYGCPVGKGQIRINGRSRWSEVTVYPLGTRANRQVVIVEEHSN